MSIIKSKKDAEIFFNEICKENQKPNKELLEAARRYKNSVKRFPPL